MTPARARRPRVVLVDADRPHGSRRAPAPRAGSRVAWRAASVRRLQDGVAGDRRLARTIAAPFSSRSFAA